MSVTGFQRRRRMQAKTKAQPPEPILDEDATRDALVAAYKAKFGKAPHGRMSPEAVRAKIEE